MTRSPAALSAVFAGGVAGGVARYAITLAWPAPDGGFPWATFAINTSGAFALAVLLGALAGPAPRRPYLRLMLGTGLLGAFTTFASVVVAADQLAAHGGAATAALYLTGSLAAAGAAAVAGLLIGRRLARRVR